MNEVLQKMFPTGVLNGHGTEVNGLNAGVIPQGVILKQAQSSFDKYNRREWFLVESDGYTALLRVCTASKGAGYDEFAVIRGIVPSSDATQVAEFHRFFEQQTS